jgi:hypothetical protein
MSGEKKRASSSLKPHKMPENSVFYEKVLPVLFVGLAVVMVLLIAFAVGVLTGIVPWA